MDPDSDRRPEGNSGCGFAHVLISWRGGLVTSGLKNGAGWMARRRDGIQLSAQPHVSAWPRQSNQLSVPQGTLAVMRAVRPATIAACGRLVMSALDVRVSTRTIAAVATTEPAPSVTLI